MKKNIFIILSVIAVVLLTGCSKIDLDLEKVKQLIATLKEEKINSSLVYGEVNMNEDYQGLEYIYEFDFEKYGFNFDDLEEYSFGYDKTTKDFYIVFKAKEGKDSSVKKSIESFVESLKKDEKSEDVLNKLKNYKLEEADGYIIAVAAEDNDELLSIIKNSKNPIFANMMEVPVESIEDVLGLKEEQV